MEKFQYVGLMCSFLLSIIMLVMFIDWRKSKEGSVLKKRPAEICTFCIFGIVLCAAYTLISLHTSERPNMASQASLYALSGLGILGIVAFGAVMVRIIKNQREFPSHAPLVCIGIASYIALATHLISALF